MGRVDNNILGDGGIDWSGPIKAAERAVIAKALFMRKVTVFGGYASRTCPACGDIKPKHRWLCAPCRRTVGPGDYRPPELLALDDACKLHLEAAERFIIAAKKARGLT